MAVIPALPVRPGVGTMPGNILWLADHLADIIGGTVNKCTGSKRQRNCQGMIMAHRKIRADRFAVISFVAIVIGLLAYETVLP